MNTSEEFIKCCLDNFSMSFILFYIKLSICENNSIVMNMRHQFLRAPYNHLIKKLIICQIIREWRIQHLMNSFDVWLTQGLTVSRLHLYINRITHSFFYQFLTTGRSDETNIGGDQYLIHYLLLYFTFLSKIII